ncbi:hypothetical protein H9Q73_004664 [Fusarium xylarioides]|nr:hypothetical protein H9Q73_004664 [Fusarium xylarioides]
MPGTPLSPQRTFMSLPTEIHLAISDFLIYPDALSLKHTSAYFYSFVDTVICVSAAGVYLYSCNEDENMWNVNLGLALAVLFMGQRHAPIAHC